MEVQIRITEIKYETDIRERRYLCKEKAFNQQCQFPFLSVRHELFIYKPGLVCIMQIC